MSSTSWKDSSDFTSLAAALCKAKNLQKASNTKPKSDELEEIAQLKKQTENIKTDSTEPTFAAEPKYSNFPEDFKLPMTECVSLKQHKSTISALEFESSGSRFLSGSHDTTVAYWDFNGMVKDQPEPFRFIEPMGSHTVIL